MRVADYFTDISQDFDSKYKDKPDFIERFSIWGKLIEQYAKGRKSAYDFGCGSGIYSAKIAEAGLTITGFDASEGMLVLSNQLKEKKQLKNLNFKQETLPLKNLSDFTKVDLIISSSVVEYIAESEEVLSSFNTLLNNKGIMIISFPNKLSIHRTIERIAFALVGKPTYLQYIKSRFSEKEIRSFAAKNNLKVNEVEYYGKVFSVYSMLSKIIGKKACNTMFVVVMEKN